jgi:hypothetical protein
MTSHSVLSEVHQEKCMRYLLGELDAAESASFETELQSSPELGDELLRQADVIAGLGCEVSQFGTPAEFSVPVEMASASYTKLLAPLIAIAASVLLIVVFSKPNNTPSPSKTVSEDLLIAKAWVAQRYEDTTDELSVDLDELSFAESTSASDNEDTLSWMFAAVASSPEDSDWGNSNDG